VRKIRLHKVDAALLKAEIKWVGGALVCVAMNHFMGAVHMDFVIRRQHFDMGIRNIFSIHKIRLYYKPLIPGERYFGK